MESFILALIRAIDLFVWIYSLIVIVRVLTTWFPGALSLSLRRFLERATEPVLAPIRRGLTRLGSTGTLDLSPLILLLGIHLARSVLVRLLLGFV